MTYTGDYPELEVLRETERVERSPRILAINHEGRIWVVKDPERPVPYELR